MAKGKANSAGAAGDLTRLHIWQIQAVRDLLLIAAVVGIVWLGYAIRAVTVPLLVALLLAYLFEPLVARLTRRGRISRAFVAGSIIASGGVIVMALLALLVPVAVGQTVDFVVKFRDGTVRRTALSLAEHAPENLRDDLTHWLEFLPVGGSTTEPGLEPDSESGVEAGAGPLEPDASGAAPPRGAEAPRVRTTERRELLDLARGGLRAVGRLMGAVVKLGFLAFLIPFYFFFFSVSYPAVASFARGLFPESGRQRAFELLGKMDAVIAGFVRGRIVISAAMGAMLALGWWFCGVPYALSLGLLVGIFCAVPYLGGIGVPVAVGLLLAKHLGLHEDQRMEWWGILLWPILVYTAVQVIESYVLTPVIAGRATNLDPVTILVAVLAGGSIMGVYGMLLAIPVTACLKILLTEVLLPRVRAWTRGEVEDPLPLRK